jgi:putative transposase
LTACFLEKRRGRVTSPANRRKDIDILDEGMAHGARARELALILSAGLSTLQRWHRKFASDVDGVDRRKGRRREIAFLSEEESQRIVLNCNEPEFAALSAGQIMPILADQRALFRFGTQL